LIPHRSQNTFTVDRFGNVRAQEISVSDTSSLFINIPPYILIDGAMKRMTVFLSLLSLSPLSSLSSSLFSLYPLLSSLSILFSLLSLSSSLFSLSSPLLFASLLTYLL
jgi:hypothetical protein